MRGLQFVQACHGPGRPLVPMASGARMRTGPLASSPNPPDRKLVGNGSFANVWCGCTNRPLISGGTDPRGQFSTRERLRLNKTGFFGSRRPTRSSNLSVRP
jgi:hypothetical protein